MIGRTLGHDEIVEKLGAGGMGALLGVFRAGADLALIENFR